MPKQAKLQPHPLAELFPLPSPADLRKLADDIREHGLREPIVRLDGKILDGRSRYAACQIAEVELLPGDFVDFTDLDGGDPLAFVLTKNLHRRHLSQSQRGMVAERLATMKQGRPGKHATLQVRRKSAATALGVSERTVADAHTVRKHGTSTLAKAVEADRVPVHTAAKLAREPVETQRKVVDSLPRDTAEARKAAREIPRQIEDARPDDAPAFNLFRVWFVIGAAALFEQDAAEAKWAKVFRHQASMPSEDRQFIVSTLRTLVVRAEAAIAKLEASRTH